MHENGLEFFAKQQYGKHGGFKSIHEYRVFNFFYYISVGGNPPFSLKCRPAKYWKKNEI
jgi:hypothetical protein